MRELNRGLGDIDQISAFVCFWKLGEISPKVEWKIWTRGKFIGLDENNDYCKLRGTFIDLRRESIELFEYWPNYEEFFLKY